MTGEDRDIGLTKEEAGKLKGSEHIGTGSRQEEELMTLSEIIKIFNEHFGIDNFTEADRLFIDQLEEDMVADEKLAKQAKNNSKDNFKYALYREFNKKLFKRMDSNQDIFTKIMNDEAFQDDIKDYLLEKVYGRLQAEA